MKKSFYLFLALSVSLLALTSCEGMLDPDISGCPISTVEDVLPYIENEWMSNPEYEIIVSKEPFKSNTPVVSMVGLNSPKGLNWVICVDLRPDAFLMHGFIYRFVNAKTGKVEDIEGANLYPNDMYEKYILLKKGSHSVVWNGRDGADRSE